MSSGKYILDSEGYPKYVEDVYEWAEWIEKSGKDRQIAYTEVGKYFVSTVFLGLDYSFGMSPDPILYETMVFKKNINSREVTGKKVEYNEPKEDSGVYRYFTKDQALKGHEKVVKELNEQFIKSKKDIQEDS